MTRMYCPACGKENSLEQKFCAACGVNLHAVAHALTRREEDFFSKMDAGMDALLGRYSEHVFGRSAKVEGDSVARSWKILGQSAVTALLDLLLFTLMSTLLPIRLILLSVSTPFRLLSKPSDGEEKLLGTREYAAPQDGRPVLGGWREDVPMSVTESTTTLFDTGKIER